MNRQFSSVTKSGGFLQGQINLFPGRARRSDAQDERAVGAARLFKFVKILNDYFFPTPKRLFKRLKSVIVDYGHTFVVNALGGFVKRVENVPGTFLDREAKFAPAMVPQNSTEREHTRSIAK